MHLDIELNILGHNPACLPRKLQLCTSGGHNSASPRGLTLLPSTLWYWIVKEHRGRCLTKETCQSKEGVTPTKARESLGK